MPLVPIQISNCMHPDQIVLHLNSLLQDHMCRKEAGLTDELASILTELTTLNNAENAKVALRARQVRSGSTTRKDNALMADPGKIIKQL